MGFRFLVIEGAAAPHHDRSFIGFERTHSSTIGTRLLFAQLAGLLLGRHFQGSRQQTTHGCHTDVFHLGQIDIQAGALLAPVLPNDDFSPPLRKFFDALEIFRRRLSSSHVASLQRDTSIRPDEILP